MEFKTSTELDMLVTENIKSILGLQDCDDVNLVTKEIDVFWTLDIIRSSAGFSLRVDAKPLIVDITFDYYTEKDGYTEVTHTFEFADLKIESSPVTALFVADIAPRCLEIYNDEVTLTF